MNLVQPVIAQREKTDNTLLPKYNETPIAQATSKLDVVGHTDVIGLLKTNGQTSLLSISPLFSAIPQADLTVLEQATFQLKKCLQNGRGSNTSLKRIANVQVQTINNIFQKHGVIAHPIKYRAFKRFIKEQSNTIDTGEGNLDILEKFIEQSRAPNKQEAYSANEFASEILKYKPLFEQITPQEYISNVMNKFIALQESASIAELKEYMINMKQSGTLLVELYGKEFPQCKELGNVLLGIAKDFEANKHLLNNPDLKKHNFSKWIIMLTLFMTVLASCSKGPNVSFINKIDGMKLEISGTSFKAPDGTVASNYPSLVDQTGKEHEMRQLRLMVPKEKWHLHYEGYEDFDYDQHIEEINSMVWNTNDTELSAKYSIKKTAKNGITYVQDYVVHAYSPLTIDGRKEKKMITESGQPYTIKDLKQVGADWQIEQYQNGIKQSSFGMFQLHIKKLNRPRITSKKVDPGRQSNTGSTPTNRRVPK